MANWFILLIVTLTLSLTSTLVSSTKVTNIILIGATGDLAQKYLWQGLFNLYKEHRSPNQKFHIFGGARVDTAAGNVLIKNIMNEKIKCEGCNGLKEEFKSKVKYQQLKKEADYLTFCAMIDVGVQNVCSNDGSDEGVCYKDSNVQEAGRLFYLSIPPYAYAETARFIDKHCRPGPQTWMRVVLEKPFGSDLGTAELLARNLQESLREEEMYRIDHYLGKTVSLEILKFRKENEDKFGELWDTHGIERIDIVMSETIDAKGRTLFYDEYGVVRDVMQNHLTELLVLVAMELPSDLKNITEVQQKKLQLLGDIQTITQGNMVIGQYEDYVSHVREDYEDNKKTSKKPTFAASLVHVSNNRWHGVDFHLISGKKLNQRASYVKVTFKNQKTCLVRSKDCKNEAGHLIFNIGHGDIGEPGIAVSRALPKPLVPWPYKEITGTIFGRDSQEFVVYVPSKDTDAYTSLISGVYNGDHDLFIGTESLMESWRIWTPVVQYLDNVEPKIYKGGHEIKDLAYVKKGNEIMFLGGKADTKFQVSLEKFRGALLYLGNTFSVTEKLTYDILQSALASIKERGVFHLALSGGTSAPRLFQSILNVRNTFPWQQTHVWIVDERCVPFEDERSNFGKIHKNLLKFLKIPFMNIHPLPIELASGICEDEDRGDDIYASSIKRLITNSQFDFVVIGAGGDGHTASLFPGAKSLLETEKSVIYSHGAPPKYSAKRLTLTFPTLNKSRKIAVLIMGEGKADIVNILRGGTMDVQKYPIVGIQPTGGDLTFYMDHGAYSNS